MERDFRRLHWRWMAMCAITATLAGCAPAPVAESDADSGALMSDAGAASPEAQAPSAVPSAGKRGSRASRATQPATAALNPESRASERPAAAAGDDPSSSNSEFALVPSRDSDQQGMASWYGPGLHGRLTASGERFDKEELTAAHRSFAFGSRVCVRSAATGKTVVVRINDRGPFAPGRVIDLSQAAAQELGMVGLGIKPVELWQLDDGEQECPETLVTAKKAEALKKTQQAKAQAKVQSRNTRAQAKAPAPKARTAVASRAPVKPAAPAAPAVPSATATAVASAAQGAR